MKNDKITPWLVFAGGFTAGAITAQAIKPPTIVDIQSRERFPELGPDGPDGDLVTKVASSTFIDDGGSPHDPSDDFFVITNPKAGTKTGWKVRKLWALAEGLTPIEMDPLDVPGFYGRSMFGGKVARLEDVVEECKRISRADLNYPVIVFDDLLLDGAHRASKALSKGHTVQVVVLPELPKPDCVYPIA